MTGVRRHEKDFVGSLHCLLALGVDEFRVLRVWQLPTQATRAIICNRPGIPAFRATAALNSNPGSVHARMSKGSTMVEARAVYGVSRLHVAL